jgi:hypothetical protein
MEYYIYLHLRADSGSPFYIGKGKNKRSTSRCSRSLYWKNIVNKYGYDVIIIESNLSNAEAILKEKYWIKRIGRKDMNNGPLVNFTDGGEGTVGKTVSIKTREAVALSNKTRLVSDINKNTTRKLFKGKFGQEHNRSKAVICVETGVEYGSQMEAQRQLKLGNGSVSWSIKHKKPIFGMHFEIK